MIRYFPPGNLRSGKEAFKKNVLPIPERERGGAIERRASLALTGFVFIVGTCCQFLFLKHFPPKLRIEQYFQFSKLAFKGIY